MFGVIYSATIKNLGIENCNIVYGNAGGLVGVSTYSYISNCYVTGNVKGMHSVGGLIGQSCCDNISNCCFSGSVNAVGRGGTSVGGLVGMFLGGCLGGEGSGYSATIISNCYVTGKVSAVNTDYHAFHVGGLVGDSYDGIIRVCVVALDSLTSATAL